MRAGGACGPRNRRRHPFDRVEQNGDGLSTLTMESRRFRDGCRPDFAVRLARTIHPRRGRTLAGGHDGTAARRHDGTTGRTCRLVESSARTVVALHDYGCHPRTLPPCGAAGDSGLSRRQTPARSGYGPDGGRRTVAGTERRVRRGPLSTPFNHIEQRRRPRRATGRLERVRFGTHSTRSQPQRRSQKSASGCFLVRA